MNSADPRRFKDEDDDDVLRGQYHGHPYGELNLVVPLNKGAELKGLQGWQGPGWTAPDPGSRRRGYRSVLPAGWTHLIRFQGSRLIIAQHIASQAGLPAIRWGRDVANLCHGPTHQTIILSTKSGSSCRWLRMIPSLGTISV